MDPEKLLLKISSGKSLSSNELAMAANVLESFLGQSTEKEANIDDAYSCILVLGKAGARQFRALFERFLAVKDPLTAALVLDILCLQWGETETHLQSVLNYALGVAWDREDDVRQMAFKIIGEYLRSCADFSNGNVDFSRNADLKREKARISGLFDLLMNAFTNEKLSPWTRQSAYCALSRAWGKEWDELPADCSLMDFSETSGDVDVTTLENSRALLRRLG
ncbi:MAG: hypothetical protein IT291_09255 [Deltaproteobacteria bacterium]|nr:hypothetical protein [Deltaproteobacteria bacterium]